MTQTVFDNAMTAHVWAQRSQPRGRSNNGNFSFERDTLYSYVTPIARFVETSEGLVVLATSRSYSKTTSGKHMPALWRAIDYGRGMFERCFTVPNVTAELVGGSPGVKHTDNLNHLSAVYDARKASELRRRGNWLDLGALTDTLEALASNANLYARLFGLAEINFTPAADAEKIVATRAERQAKADTPAARARREAKRVKGRAETAERLEQWRRGEVSTMGNRRTYDTIHDENGGAYLRVRGDKLETSLGATAPLPEAIKVFRFVKRCRDRGESWRRNGETLPVGQFQVDEITPVGDFRAGCHRINWPEIERAAKAAGVWED